MHTTFLILLAFIGTASAVGGVALLWRQRMGTDVKLTRQRLAQLREFHTGPAQRSIESGHHDQAEWVSVLQQRSAGFRALQALVVLARHGQSAQAVLGWSLVMGVGSLAALWLVMGWHWWLPVVSLLVGNLPAWRLKRHAFKRRDQFEAKLPEALDYIARALRAGHSLTAAIGMAGNELAAPIGVEFKQAFDEISFGIGFNDAMGQMAERMQSADLNFLVVALLLQRETGGNLTELLEGLSKTIRERIKLRGKVRTLSAEGRFSAQLLGGLPLLLGGVMTLINPNYMAMLWFTEAGHTLILIGLGLMAMGAFILSRIIEIKV